MSGMHLFPVYVSEKLVFPEILLSDLLKGQKELDRGSNIACGNWHEFIKTQTFH